MYIYFYCDSSEHQVNVIDVDYNTFRTAEEVISLLDVTVPVQWSSETIDAVATL